MDDVQRKHVLETIQDLVFALTDGWRRFKGAKEVCQSGKKHIYHDYVVSNFNAMFQGMVF